MTYRPNPDQTRPTLLSFLLLAVGLAGYAAGAAVGRYTWLFQAVCLGGVVASLYLLMRWRMTWFVYGIRLREDSTAFWEGAQPVYAGPDPLRYASPEQLDLVVVKGQGGRAGAMECVLGLDTLVEAFPVVRKENGNSGRGEVYRPRALQNRYPGAKVYEYMQTYNWQEGFVAVFRDGTGCAILLLDLPPESEMARYLVRIV